MIKLSICIPTYNFGQTIGETLDSILTNNLDGVEIVILDGGSTDNTKSEVQIRLDKFSRIVYHNQGFKGGIDLDIAKAISLSSGEYCWLFSADDVMKPFSINTVIRNLQFSYDILLCEQTICDNNLVYIKEHPIFINLQHPRLFYLNNKKNRTEYFKLARTTEAFFSYLAGPIFKKSVWDKGNELIPQNFNQTCWGLAGRLLILFPLQDLRIYYLGESLINKRAGIDSFMDKGIVNRLKITIDGFAYISNCIFGKNSFETMHVRRVIRNEDFFSLKNLISVKIQIIENTNELMDLNNVVYNHYKDAGLLNLFKYIIYKIINKFIYNLLKFFKKLIKKSNRNFL
jgi:abequosyltransferase